MLKRNLSGKRLSLVIVSSIVLTTTSNASPVYMNTGFTDWKPQNSAEYQQSKMNLNHTVKK